MGNFAASFEQKMTAAGMGDAAIRAFRRNYEALLRKETGMIPEETISPPDHLDVCSKPADIHPSGRRRAAGAGRGHQAQRRPRHQHGPAGPKSLLAVRPG
jgi:UTP--glucose-1-phosphate uridylyltransferase